MKSIVRRRDSAGGRAPRLSRLTYANVVATLALFLVLSGGSAVAATKLIKGSQIAPGTITGANIKKATLLAADFKSGQIPAGATGAAGAAGATGATGSPGATGAPGVAGTPGAAGSGVAAYAAIVVTGTSTAEVVQNSGFSTTVTMGTNASGLHYFCLTATSNYTGVPLFVTSVNTANEYVGSPRAADCTSGQDEIVDANNGTEVTGEGFDVLVP